MADLVAAVRPEALDAGGFFAPPQADDEQSGGDGECSGRDGARETTVRVHGAVVRPHRCRARHAHCHPAVTARRHAVPMRVLVVEDHERLATAIADGLRREGMAVDLVLDGTGAIAHTTITDYDVVVLDRDLPGVHGDQVCRALVQRGSHTRVLMLTASDTIRDRVAGLELGADDYLGKPFDFSELVARVRALARRATPAAAAAVHARRPQPRPGAADRSRGDRRLDLTPKEFAVLEHLLAADGRPVSAEELLERVWDEAANPFTTTVKTTVARLRAKLGEPPLIETVREGGYRI